MILSTVLLIAFFTAFCHGYTSPFEHEEGLLAALFDEPPSDMRMINKTFNSESVWTKSLIKRTESALRAIDFVDPSKSEYGIAIDAGSSHTEAILFTWSAKLGETGFVRQVADCDQEPGIDEGEGKDVDKTVAKVMSCVEKLVNKIPADHKGPFTLLMGATAGMRVLQLKNPTATNMIFQRLYQAFRGAEFDGRVLFVTKPRIISGFEEGQFAWIAANYLMKFIPPENSDQFVRPPHSGSIGIMDMGGASAQIAFRTSDNPDGQVELFGQTYPIRAYSNLCFGSVEAKARYQLQLLLDRIDKTKSVVEDPCLGEGDPPTIVKGSEFIANPCLNMISGIEKFIDPMVTYTFTGGLYNSSQCRAQVKQLTDLKACRSTFKHCFERDDRSKRRLTFLGLSSYYYTFRLLPTLRSGRDTFPNENVLLDEIDWWCNQPSDYRAQNAGASFADALCFRQHYSFYTMKNVYGFNKRMWPRVHFVRKIGDNNMGWSLGYMLWQTNMLPEKDSEKSLIKAEAYHALSNIYQQASNLVVRVNSQTSNLVDHEEELSSICDQIIDVMDAKILFNFQGCGTKNKRVESCCRVRLAEWRKR
ncbi:ectonucleoside triphosphate diphosphohydrolase 3-like [Brevipalpus obovatus]|uniref:ectonucleoside triphosphate diphosphohydrolase 3-like n=1 Tax=Brevipalpus obovatus TaxID=246614 RepID=UPI003D9DC206